MSFSFTWRRISITLKSATRITSVPANWPVATTRSPCCELSTEMTPSMGEEMVVFCKRSRVCERALSARLMSASEDS